MALPETAERPLPLPIQHVKGLPRRVKRRIWNGWWKYHRLDIPGENRLTRRRNWRAVWAMLRRPHRGW